jgi:putative membrane protein
LASGVTQLSTGATTLADGSEALADGSGDLAAGAATLADGNGQIADGSDMLATGASGAAPMILPWLLGISLAGIIAIGFWIGHRVSHRSRFGARATATA